MSLRRFFEVIHRFKFLVAAGVLLALVLALLSIVRVSFDTIPPTIAYRGEERWQSNATLFVTQEGFPWGRSVVDEALPVGPDAEAGYVPRYSAPDRFQTLAQLYAEFAMSDDVRAIMLREGPIVGEYEVGPVSSRDGSTFLPLVGFAGYGATPEQAQTLAGRVMDAFLLYLRERQVRADIPAEKRVDVQVLERPGKPELVEGRKLTRPIFLFVLVLTSFLALAFALENLRPRHRPSELRASPEPTPMSPAARRSA